MLRPSRPLTVCLLWLAIALLPLRAWAAAAMPMAGVPMPSASQAQTQTPSAYAAQVQAAALHEDDAPTMAAESGSPHSCHSGSMASTSPDCTLCDVCHGAVAVGLDGSARPPLRVSRQPRIEPAPAIERPVIDAPDRPPRLFLA